MFRSFLAISSCVIAGTASASPIDPLDLMFQVESSGYSGVSVFNENGELSESYAFLDISDDIWGLSGPRTGFFIGDVVSVTSQYDDETGTVAECSIGALTCDGGFGTWGEDQFSIGDGTGGSSLGDYIFRGGTQAGDSASLQTFDGAPVFEPLGDGGYVTWSSFDTNFSVVAEEAQIVPFAAPDEDVVPVPVPASLPLLVAGLMGLGVMRRRASKT